MRVTWLRTSVGEVCHFVGGGTPSTAIEDYWQGDIPWVSPKDMKAEVVNDSIDHISEKAITGSAAALIPRGSVLIVVRSGILNRIVPIALTGRSLTINQDLKALCPSAVVDSRFLFYLLKSRMEELLGFVSRGATVHRITTDVSSELNVPSAPLPEQRRIVGILDEAFAAIASAKANTEKNLQNARALFENHLHQVFALSGEGWQVKRVSEVAKHSLGKMLDKAKNQGEPQPYLRNVNVRWFGFDLSDLLQMRFLPEEAARYTVRQGDVLVCEGGYPGRAAIWPENSSAYFQKALHRVRFHEPGHNKWFVYYLYSQDRQAKLQHLFTGTGIQHFTGEVLSQFKMPIPPSEDLRRLVGHFDELASQSKRLQSLYQQKLIALDALKQSLLHQAFSGNL